MAERVKIEGAKLYGVSLSPFVRKVRGALALKEIDAELEAVMPGAMDPGFVAKSPLSKIPVWEEAGGYTLPDSSAICAYLERRVPEPSLYGGADGDPHRFGEILFWEEYGDTRLVESAGPPFIQRVVQARVFKQAADEEIVRRHVEEILPPVQDQIEALFVESGIARPEAPSVADLAIWTSFVNLEHAGIDFDASRWPALGAFVRAMNAHPKLAPLVEDERESVASLG